MLRAFWDGAVSIDATGDRFDERRMPLAGPANYQTYGDRAVWRTSRNSCSLSR